MVIPGRKLCEEGFGLDPEKPSSCCPRWPTLPSTPLATKRGMSVSTDFLPSRDLRQLKALDLASPECLDDVTANLDSLATVLGASGGQILHAPPQPTHNDTQAHDDLQSSVEDPPQETDAFEQRYITRWLTRLVSEFAMTSADSQEMQDRCELLSQQCAELLALAAGKMAAGASIQDHIFQLSDGELTVKLRDGALVHDSLGTHTWGAAPILSQLLLPIDADPQRDLDVLELGAGTGLVGLSLARWSRQHRRDAGTRVVCTDHHPTVLENLAHNIQLNRWPESVAQASQAQVDVTARCLDWQSVHQARSGQASSAYQLLTSQTVPSHLVASAQSDWARDLDIGTCQRSFDLIVAADCIYDPVHPLWIRSVAESLLKPADPSSGVQPLLHIMVPLRPTHQAEMQAVYEAFAADRPGDRGLRLAIQAQSDYQGYENFGAWNSVVRAAGPVQQSQPEGGLARTYRWFIIGWQSASI